MLTKVAQWVVLALGRLTFGVLRLFEKAGIDMAAVDQAIADWTDYANALKAQRDAAIKLAEDNALNAQNNANALAQFQADDAATDASQLADKEAADAKAFADALAALKAQDVPTAPDETPAPPVDTTPPVDPTVPVETDPPAPFDPGPPATDPVVTDPATDAPVDGTTGQ